jgi:hypothetical protein
MFTNCIKVSIVWQNVIDWLVTLDRSIDQLTSNDIIFGIPNASHYYVNFYILHAKWFIHINRERENINFVQFQNYMRCNVTFYKEIAISSQDKTGLAQLDRIQVALNQ